MYFLVLDSVRLQHNRLTKAKAALSTNRPPVYRLMPDEHRLNKSERVLLIKRVSLYYVLLFGIYDPFFECEEARVKNDSSFRWNGTISPLTRLICPFSVSNLSDECPVNYSVYTFRATSCSGSRKIILYCLQLSVSKPSAQIE
jgi:hypothetical protein